MSLFRRRFLLWIPLVLCACGFTPVYGPGGTATGSLLQNNVLVSEPDALDGYIVTRRIEERLGRSSVPTYSLALDVKTETEGLAVNPENNINRFNIIGEARYALTEQSTGRVITSGVVDNFTGASASGTTIATLAAEREARERLMILLADQVVIRLLATDLS